MVEAVLRMVTFAILSSWFGLLTHVVVLEVRRSALKVGRFVCGGGGGGEAGRQVHGRRGGGGDTRGEIGRLGGSQSRGEVHGRNRGGAQWA